ncbi:hypothetical protein JTE90_025638 [Oedothorax gibbosus]|uniref:Homeobox domain-containing protein n=1 Tax=Oedothorax gibbosus TaxID=931172 RepID=A0AAV6VB71_9ARAC|nr:hypothetical protein JTE90_025638 [Oedothorax gibbosus]
MTRSSELSDFEKGIIIGYHKCGRSLRDISSDLKYPKSTVAYVIKKWKVTGDRRNVPRVGRPTKLGDRDRRVLSIEIWKNRTQPMALIREEHQQASGSIVSMNTIRKEAHLLGFHGHAAAHKPLITEFNLAARLMWCKHIEIGPYRSVETGSLERRIKVHPLPFGWQGMDLASAWRTSPARMHCANSQVRWRWNYSLGVFLLRRYGKGGRKVRRNRTVFTELQLMGLERRFDCQKYLSTPDRAELARALNLTQLQVKTWYQNRRMKWKKQVMQDGCTVPPTKPKGRPKKNSIPSLNETRTANELAALKDAF